jgi:uncharacterized membrane protein YeaQ/YmgE (transglycosylase-associated protein family)
MTNLGILWALLIGLTVGSLVAWLTIKHRGFGYLTNMIVGAIGSLLGWFIYGWIGFQNENIWIALLFALLGAGLGVGVLFLFRKKE